MEKNRTPRDPFVENITDNMRHLSAQSWPILMIIVIGISLLPILMSELPLKVIGIICLIFGVCELKKWNAAKKAGEQYCPAYAIIAYIALVVVTILLVFNIFFSSSNPIHQVKNTTFDAYPSYTIGEIINYTIDDPEWSYTDDDVYVYGYLDGELIGFEFRLDSKGDYFYVSLSDAYYMDTWWGELMATAYFADLASSIPS